MAAALGPAMWHCAAARNAANRRLRSPRRVASTTWLGSAPSSATVVRSGRRLSPRKPADTMATAWPLAMSSNLSSNASTNGPSGADLPSGRGSTRQYALQVGSGSRGTGSPAMSSNVTDCRPAKRWSRDQKHPRLIVEDGHV